MKKELITYSFKMSIPYHMRGTRRSEIDPLVAFRMHRSNWADRMHYYDADVKFACFLAHLADDQGEKFEMKYKETDHYLIHMRMIVPDYVYSMARLLYGMSDD